MDQDSLGINEETARLLNPAASGYCVRWPEETAIVSSADVNSMAEHLYGEGLLNERHELGITAPCQSTGVHKPRQRQAKAKESKRDDYQYVTFDGKRFVGGMRTALRVQRRKQIREVRAKGACIRCQLRKISVREMAPPKIIFKADGVLNAQVEVRATNA